jgi:transposase
MFYLGIDVAKRKHTAMILDGQGQVIRRAFSFTNDRSGFGQLLAEIRALPESVIIGLEATGHYWLALYDHLTRREHTVLVLNPLQIAAYRRTGIRKRKTDRHDAYWIADFVRIGGGQPSQVPQQIILQIRELARFRFRLIQQIGDCKRKAISVLDRVFPEYETFFSNMFIRTSRRLLQKAVTAEEFAALPLDELHSLLSSSSRGRFGLSKAQQIIDTAARSVGVSFLADAARLELHCLLNQIEFLEGQVADIDAALDTLLQQTEQHLTTIPGIGSTLAAALLGEIGDVNRFATLEKLVAYAGIDPTVYQTGQFEARQAHMSKRGSPYLRHALWLAASAARQHDPQLKAYYERRRAEGKAHGVVIGAICRKLLARVYAVLVENRPYVIDQL